MAKLVRLYVPYMGNKFQIKDFIINSLIKRKPKAKYFYDLFGGGGSISIAALQTQRFKKVYYNETQKKIVSLMEYLKSLDSVPDEFYEWVSRDKFWEVYEQEDENWYKGFVQQIWSFGNKGDSYIYGRDREEWKRLAHEAIVHNDFSALQKIDEDFHIGFKPFEGSFIETRRSEFRKQISDYLRAHKDELEPDFAKRVKQLGDLQHFPRINTLKNLIESGVLKNLEISNGSYEDFDIQTSDEESIIYCFDKDTEFLTADGWKYGKDLRADDAFYSIDTQTGAVLRSQKADMLIKYPYRGMMYKYADENVDLVVTPNHRILTARRFAVGDKLKAVPANKFYGRAGVFPIGARRYNKTFEAYPLPGLTGATALLLGVWLSEYAQTKNATIKDIDYIVTQVPEFGRLWTEFDIGHEPLGIASQVGLDVLNSNGLKNIIERTIKETPEAAEALLMGLLLGPAAHTKSGWQWMPDYDKPLFGQGYIETTKTWVKDIVMRLLVLSGFAAKAQEQDGKYRVMLTDGWCSKKNKKYECWDFYDDMVYCVRLPKHHTVAVRRNGKTVWCGQCDIPYFSTAKYQGEASGFDHAKYYEWQKRIGKSVFTSEYTMPDEFSLIDSTKKRVLLAAQGAQKTADEKIFWNNLGEINAEEDKAPAEQLKMEL